MTDDQSDRDTSVIDTNLSIERTNLQVSQQRLQLQSCSLQFSSNSKMWPPAACRELLRTNNDAYGWNYRRNRKAQRSVLNTYFMISLPAHDAVMVDINAKFKRDQKVLRSQWKSVVVMQAKLKKYWEEYQVVYTRLHDVIVVPISHMTDRIVQT